MVCPGEGVEVASRTCGCTFCRKHAASWTSRQDWELNARLLDASLVSKYRFGTNTAEFYICSSCGVVPFAVCDIRDRRYAVVNVNTFTDNVTLVPSSTDFDSEEIDDRIDRREHNWISNVQISVGAAQGAGR